LALFLVLAGCHLPCGQLGDDHRIGLSQTAGRWLPGFPSFIKIGFCHHLILRL